MPHCIPKKDGWRVHVKRIEAYHLRKVLLSSYHWSIRLTAKNLNRSLASVSEDLRLSLALRIYPEVEEFPTKSAALNYLREKRKCQTYPCAKWTKFEIEEVVKTLTEELEDYA